MPTRARRSGHARGFTLVELMVAMVGGMFVSFAVFTLAKHSSAFSLRQARIADATLQNVVGFERLKADIARAGFLSTPNLVNDPNICGDREAAGYPAWLGRLASVFIEAVPPLQRSSEMTLNGIIPSRIVLSGSYASADEFVARNIIGGAEPTVFLVPNSLGMANINYPATLDPTALGQVFATGRALRIVDDAGKTQFGVIAGVTGGANPTIELEPAPALEFRADSGLRCGIRGHGKNVVNVVNIVRYDFRDLNDASLPEFSHMFRGGPSYEATRRELIREELDVTGTPIDGTLELIAEYAVDLGFSILVAPDTASPLVRFSGNDVANYAGDPVGLGLNAGPQLIRAVHAWLSVRSQEADRTAPIDPLVTAGPGPNLLRISVHPTDRDLPPFARVRTLQSTIPLNNQARETW